MQRSGTITFHQLRHAAAVLSRNMNRYAVALQYSHQITTDLGEKIASGTADEIGNSAAAIPSTSQSFFFGPLEKIFLRKHRELPLGMEANGPAQQWTDRLIRL